MGPSGNHRLDREDEPGPEHDALTGVAPVRNLRLLVHLRADPVPDEGADDTETVGLGVGLNGVADIENRELAEQNHVPGYFRHSWVTRISRSASGETLPIGIVAAVSET